MGALNCIQFYMSDSEFNFSSAGNEENCPKKNPYP